MLELKDGVWWVGYVDWDLRSFHGYSTPHGSTYNAYLILDEKPTLIDTVKHYGFEEMFSRIKQLIEPEKIQYIISNHTEMDHSGSIDKLIEYCPNAEVVCSPKGKEGLLKHFKKDWKFKVVKTGDTLNIGKRDLQFFLMPMVHWPDSMATYSGNDSILFPNDAFGQHYASHERFADEIGSDIVIKELEKYYANIILPYGDQVLSALDAFGDIKLDMICTSHGLIWRKKEDIEKVVSLYYKWANYKSDKQVTIIYATMWHSTEKLATRLYELIDAEGIEVKLINLAVTDHSDVITDIMRSRVVLAGSSILNSSVLPKMAGFLTYLRGLKPRNRFGFCFGSYGWSKTGFVEFENYIKDAGIELIDEGRYFQYVPEKEDFDNLADLLPKIKEKLASD